MTALLLLASTFALVFCLGLQSQLVNNGHFAAAYLAGGPFGIVANMAVYRRKFKRHPCNEP